MTFPFMYTLCCYFLCPQSLFCMCKKLHIKPHPDRSTGKNDPWGNKYCPWQMDTFLFPKWDIIVINRQTALWLSLSQAFNQLKHERNMSPNLLCVHQIRTPYLLAHLWEPATYRPQKNKPTIISPIHLGNKKAGSVQHVWNFVSVIFF